MIDQFEQWLFARRGEQNTELVAALRQCDGEHVQAIVHGSGRFLDGGDPVHERPGDPTWSKARTRPPSTSSIFCTPARVLTAFGRAYGVLPEKSSELTPEQRAFLEQAVAGLAQDGKVISVRLALFAEMVKGKPWTPATLEGGRRHAGRGRDVSRRDLQCHDSANPEHRLHQKAAQAVLKALLARDGHRHQGPDAVGGRAARGLGLRRPARAISTT